MAKNKDKVKKNLLDLEYTKYLQYHNTCVIVLFTYLIGVSIGFITKQIDYRSFNQLLLVAFVSIFGVSILVILMLQCKGQMDGITGEIRRLKI